MSWGAGGELARAIAACTSCAAASMSRSRANWSVICVLPSALVEDIESMPAMVEKELLLEGRRHRGGHGLGAGPGSEAETEMVGKSTLGRSETGSSV